MMIKSYVFYGDEGQSEVSGHLTGGNRDPLFDKKFRKEGSVVRVKTSGRLGLERFKLFHIGEFEIVNEAVREARSQGSRDEKKEYGKPYNS